MNSKVYAEVYQILQYLPENEYQCIPKEKIKYLEENMDRDVGKICNIMTDIEEIELSSEAKAIFISLYYNYIANDEKKVKLKKFLLQEEKRVLEASYKNMFNNTKMANDEKNNPNTTLAVIPKETIFIKIKNKLLYLINKIKN